MKWLLLIIGVWLIGCGNVRPPLEPDEVASQFLDAYVGKDFTKAGKFTTPQGVTQLKGLEHDAEQFRMQLDTAYIWKGTVQATTDTVWMGVVWDTIKKPIDTLLLPMVRVDRKWRVAFQRIDPVGVARMFLHAFNNNDIERAKSLVTPASRHDLDLVEEMFATWYGPKVIISDIRYDKSGQKAIVYYREEGSLLEKKLNLVHYQGSWRVAFTKIPEFEQ